MKLERSYLQKKSIDFTLSLIKENKLTLKFKDAIRFSEHLENEMMKLINAQQTK